MYWFLIDLFFTIIALGTSIPVCQSNGIPFLDAVTKWLAFLTFSGCMCGFLMMVLRPLTKIHFDPQKKIWRIPQWEQKIYKKINVHRLQKIVPDFGFLVNFKKKIAADEIKSMDFYKKFIYENVNGSLLHFCDIWLSLLFFFFLPKEFYLTIGLVGMIMIFVLNMMSVILQRSVRPRLLQVYERLKAREEKKQ